MDLLEQCRRLKEDVFQYRLDIRECGAHVHNIAFYGKQVDSEYNFLEKATRETEVDDNRHAIRSSNIRHLRAVWDVARSSPGLVAFSKSFPAKPRPITADIVSRQGHEWIKVSSLTQKSLLFDLANLDYGYSSDDSEGVSTTLSESFEELHIVKVVRKMLHGANMNPKLGSPPKILLHFANMAKNTTRQDPEKINQIIRQFYDYIRELGVTIVTDTASPLSLAQNVAIKARDEFGNSEFDSKATMINLDITSLFVLVSDISNSATEVFKSDSSLRYQVDEEEQVAVLPTRLFPLIGTRKLVTTAASQARFLEIVEMLGSDMEKRRTTLLFSVDRDAVNELDASSVHDWPLTMRLPIECVRFERPPEMPPFCVKLPEISQNVFESGWAGRIPVSVL